MGTINPTPVALKVQDVADGKVVAMDAAENDVLLVANPTGEVPPASTKYALQLAGADRGLVKPRAGETDSFAATVTGLKVGVLITDPPQALQQATTVGAMAVAGCAIQGTNLWMLVKVWDGSTVVDPGVDDTPVYTDPPSGAGYSWACNLFGAGAVVEVPDATAVSELDPAIVTWERIHAA